MTIFLCLHRFRPTIVTCPIPDGSKPNFVSMDTEESPWKLTHNLMKVQYNSLEKPTRNFTMCLAPMHGIPITPVNLVQYFEFNILLGADTFIVYNYSMNVNSLKRILMYYQKKGIVKIVQWSLPPRLNKTVWYYAQISMLNDCLYRNRGRSRYIVNTDLDEFIVPLKQRGWGDFVSKAGPACEYEVRNVRFKVFMRLVVASVHNTSSIRHSSYWYVDDNSSYDIYFGANVTCSKHHVHGLCLLCIDVNMSLLKLLASCAIIYPRNQFDLGW